MLAIRVSKAFTMLECLLALCLFSAILILCEGMFVIQKKSTITVLDDIQQLDRVRQLYLRLDPLIRQAGFLGIQSFSSGLPISIQEGMPYSHMPKQALTLHRSIGKTWDPPLPAVLTSKVAIGTDVLIIESANLTMMPKAGWFVRSDGVASHFFYSESPPLASDDHAVVALWQVIAIYAQKSETGIDLMQKSLLPMSDAVSILTGLSSFQCEAEGKLIKVTVKFQDELVHVWVGQDNAT